MNGFLTIVEFRKIDGPPGPPIGVRITLEDIEQTITPFGFKRKRSLMRGYIIMEWYSRGWLNSPLSVAVSVAKTFSIIKLNFSR